ncbi:MAG: hypothetical protein CMP67_02100 [Flavobacteriales bacterium]|nr:hypothetical protein [Flavobacteriales bacterium]|tara:strand:+ start:466 stop:1452 length:987 start_codon:yes stop_codon:yes gene_type:complete
MRLNQLAKKVGRPYTRVEKYIRKDLKIEGIEGPNSRVEEEVVKKVISKFGLSSEVTKEKPKVKLETIEAKPAEISPEDRGLEDVELDHATPAEAVVPNLDGLGEQEIEESNSDELESEDMARNSEEGLLASDNVVEEIVETDNLNERVISKTLETEETVLHIDEEGTIVAPKIELEGIKVRGKIDIPGVTDQPEKTPEENELTPEETAQLEAEEAAKLKAQEEAEEARRKKLDKEAAKALAYKEKREREEQEALRLKIEEQKEKKKEAGKKHYLDNVQQPPKIKKGKKKKVVKLEQEKENNKPFETKEKYASTDSMTTWQKIVRWFNT